MTTLEVQIGRLKKRITKLQNQREFYKEQYEYFKHMVEMYPHIRSNYRAYEERKEKDISYRALEVRVFEQSQLIKRLMEEQCAKGNNI